MSTSTEDTVTVTFDPTAINKQSDVIGSATSSKAGALTASLFRKLESLVPGVGTLKRVYDNGASSADQTMNLDAAKGGPVVLKPTTPSFGSMLSAFTLAGDLIFDLIDGGFNIIGVSLAKAFVRFDPVFGSPVMGAQPGGDGFMSYTADGVGPLWAGTGMSPESKGADSNITFSLQDNAFYNLNKFGFSIDPAKAVGVNIVTGAPNPIAFSASRLWHTPFGANLTIVGNAITITDGIHRVGDGVISNINKPYPTFRGAIWLIPNGGVGFTWNATGNIATSGSTTPNVPVVAITDGTTWYIKS